MFLVSKKDASIETSIIINYRFSYDSKCESNERVVKWLTAANDEKCVQIFSFFGFDREFFSVDVKHPKLNWNKLDRIAIKMPIIYSVVMSFSSSIRERMAASMD